MEHTNLIDPEELEEAIERSQYPEGGGGGRKSRKNKGFGLERKGRVVKEKITEEAKKNNEALKNAKVAITEKVGNILAKETNPALHKGVRDYFEWVRYGLLALDEAGQEGEVMKNEDLSTEFVRASGPGGQNVNKTSSAVAIKHKPSRIFLKEMGSRTQPENLQTARIRMQEKLADHLGKWKLTIGENESGEVMAGVLSEATVGNATEPRSLAVLKDIEMRLREGRNLI